MIINRNWNRTEHDDFVLNVQPRISDSLEAMPLYVDGKIVGWKIQGGYE